MNKIILTLVLIFMSIALWANTPAELIAEYENLPKDKQAILKSKHSFFTDENIERFKKLTPLQQNQMVEKLNIDLSPAHKQLLELKKTSSVKKNENKNQTRTSQQKDILNPDEELEPLTELNDFDEQKNKKTQVKEEPKKTDLEKLKEQYRPLKDERKILSDITTIDKVDIKHLEKDENATVENLDPLNPNPKSNRREDTEKDKRLSDTTKELPKERILKTDFNIIDSKVDASIQKLDVVKDISKYGYDLFKKKRTIGVDEFPLESTIIVRDDYLLGPSDELSLQLYGNKSKNVILTIDANGKAYFPEVGPVDFNGLTFKEAKKYLEKLVAEKMLNTSVYITATNIRKLKVFLMGEFEAPGMKTILSSNSLLDVLVQSGGIKEIGSLRKIQVNRDSKVLAEIDLYDFIQKGFFDHSVIIKENDIIFCPVIENQITVVGAVVRPAYYEIQKGTTIKEALQIAGNTRADAYLKSVKIDRSVAFEKRKIIELDLSDANAENWSYEIKNGDIISVDHIPYERSNSVFLAGNVKRPGVYAWREGLKLTDIIKGLDDLKPETDLSYAVIERVNSQTKKPELLSFNLEDVVSKKTKEVLLLSHDKVIIYELSDFQERPVVMADGQFIRPEFYQFYEGMRVTDLILAAGGLRADAHLERAEVLRWNKKTNSFNVFKLDLKKLFDPENNIVLNNRDKLTVHSMWDIGVKEFVEIKGLVNNPGKFLFYDKMKLSDLIFASGSFKEFADQSFVSIHRNTIDEKGVFSLEFISANYKKIAEGTEGDVLLKPSDVVEIFEIKKFVKDASVIVVGEVKKPGPYQWGEGLKVSDLIKIAGGLEKSAYSLSAELTHYEIVNGEQRLVAHETINLEKIKNGDKSADKFLKPYDELNILKIPGWDIVATVEIKGEVLYPGVYSIEKGETITDLIERAGGLTERAYPFAAFFSREKIRVVQREQLDKRAEELERRLSEVNDKGDDEDAKLSVSRQNLEQLISRIRETKVTGRISLNLESALANHKNANNITLEGNDILIIPRKSNVVNVIGEVRNPTTFILNEKNGVSDYISKSGGYTDYANSKKVYVVRADGSVAYLKQSGFKNSVLVYNDKRSSNLLPGDTIVIPEKLDRYSGMKLTKDISQILFQVSLAVAAFASL